MSSFIITVSYVVIVLQSSSLSLNDILYIYPKWKLSPGAGEGEIGLRPVYWAIILSIMNQLRLSEYAPLRLLSDESFSMLRAHLWPFSVPFSLSEREDLHHFVALVSEEESPPCFISTQMLAWFHSHEEINARDLIFNRIFENQSTPSASAICGKNVGFQWKL